MIEIKFYKKCGCLETWFNRDDLCDYCYNKNGKPVNIYQKLMRRIYGSPHIDFFEVCWTNFKYFFIYKYEYFMLKRRFKREYNLSIGDAATFYGEMVIITRFSTWPDRVSICLLDGSEFLCCDVADINDSSCFYADDLYIEPSSIF